MTRVRKPYVSRSQNCYSEYFTCIGYYCILCYMSGKSSPTFSALNIRHFPRDLLRRCKVRALEMDLSLRELVIEALSRYVSGGRKG